MALDSDTEATQLVPESQTWTTMPVVWSTMSMKYGVGPTSWLDVAVRVTD
jgi:hypothetical protein